jgi:hypothetical protein
MEPTTPSTAWVFVTSVAIPFDPDLPSCAASETQKVDLFIRHLFIKGASDQTLQLVVLTISPTLGKLPKIHVSGRIWLLVVFDSKS